MPLHRFEAAGNTYTFPTTLGTFLTNFKDFVPHTTRLPGTDGGFDEYGSSPAARAIGNVQQTYVIQSPTVEGLDALIDSANAMGSWGRGFLYYRPTNYPTQAERRAWVRVSNINMSKNEGMGVDRYWQTVQVSFQASSPVWEQAGTASSLGIGHTGTSTDSSATNAGNLLTLPTIAVITGGSQVLTAPWALQRLVSSVVVDEIGYTFSLPNSVTVTFDCRAGSVVYNDGTPVDGYSGALVDYLHPDWMRLMPGANTLRVVSADAGDAGQVNLTWRNAWY